MNSIISLDVSTFSKTKGSKKTNWDVAVFFYFIYDWKSPGIRHCTRGALFC